MRNLIFAAFCVIGGAFAASAAANDGHALTGTWRTAAPAENDNAEGFITFSANGQFCAADRASAHEQLSYAGRYSIEDGMLILHATTPEAQSNDAVLTFDGANRISLLFIGGEEMHLVRQSASYDCVDGAPSGLPPYSARPSEGARG